MTEQEITVALGMEVLIVTFAIAAILRTSPASVKVVIAFLVLPAFL